MLDQCTVRKHTIPELILEVVDQQSTQPPASLDPTYAPDSSVMDVDYETEFERPSAPQAVSRRTYTKRYDAFNFAMVCDRFGISDRVAGYLASALFEDIDFDSKFLFLDLSIF